MNEAMHLPRKHEWSENMRKQTANIFQVVLILILVMAITTACGSSQSEGENSYNSDWKGAIEQSQGAQIEDTLDHQVVATYSEEAELKEFIDALAIDEWKETELPEDLKMEYNVSFFKEGSIDSGSDSEDSMDSGDDSEGVGSLTVVARIKTYSDSNIILLESLGLSLSFEIPDSALDAIRNGQ